MLPLATLSPEWKRDVVQRGADWARNVAGLSQVGSVGPSPCNPLRPDACLVPFDARVIAVFHMREVGRGPSTPDTAFLLFQNRESVISTLKRPIRGRMRRSAS